MTRPQLPQVPLEADETTMLVAFLEFYRAALVDRALELTHEQLQMALAQTWSASARLAELG